jgi:dTDP-4-dehydrorhamnose reductase
MKKRILVTGASGFLGWNLCNLLKNSFSLLGCYHTHKITLPGVKSVQIDLRVQKQVQELFAGFRPHIVIHTAALSHPNYCEDHVEESFQVNVSAARIISDICSKHDARLVFTSSDMVFDGEHAPYEESSPINPINRYGEHKTLAESYIQQHNPKAVICRLTPMYGRPGPYAGSFLQDICMRLQNGREVPLFTDEFRTPLCVEDAADGLLCAAEAGLPVLHLAGDERLSRYELGCMIADVFGLHKRLIKPCRQECRKQKAARPRDLSLVNDSAKSMGFKPRSMYEVLKTYGGF